MTDAPCWQLFFPSEARYAGAHLPPWLSDVLRSTSGGGEAVRVTWGDESVDADALAGCAGLVSLGAAPSEADLRDGGFQHVQRFLALPNLTSLRWLIPVENAADVAAQVVPRGYRTLSRLQRLGLLAVLRLRPSLLRSRLVTIASRQRPALMAALEQLFPGHELSFSVSAGTPGPMQKPTLACFDRDGSALAYAKVATSSAAETLVRNEAAVLRHIGETPRLRGIAPALLAEDVIDGRLTVVQSALAGRQPSQHLGEAHVRFLDALRSDDVRQASEGPFLTALKDRLRTAGCPPQLDDLLQDAGCALHDVSLPSTLMHGDFAPWNLREAGGDISAFDWEYGVIDGLPGLDQLHHVWQTGLLLEKRSPDAALQALDDCARFLRLGLDERQSAALVNLYLLHGLLHRLEMGCDENDALVTSYRSALHLRTATPAVPV